MKQCKCGTKVKAEIIGINELGIWLNCPACKTTMISKGSKDEIPTDNNFSANDWLRRRKG